MTKNNFKIALKPLMALLLIMSCAWRMGAAKIEFDGREAATVGVMVVDLRSGKTIESENQDVAMIPASVMKSLTTATSMMTLGPDFRYQTEVKLDGSVKDNCLQGNLVIRSAGDPTINSEYFEDSPNFIDEIIAALKVKGIVEISGAIIVDEQDFMDPGQNPQWTVGDVGFNYGAGVYGFNFSDNVFKLYTSDLKTVPEVPVIDVLTELTTADNDVIHGINSDNYIVIGPNVEKPKNFVVTPMNVPSDVFAYNLEKQLAKGGISVAGNFCEPTLRPEILLTHQSPANLEIMRSLMFRSDNMMAEATLRSIAPGKSRSDAIKKEIAWWKDRGVNTRYAKVFDGSGLARSNRLTPSFLADIYAEMAKSKYRSEYVSIFPKVGVDGTVKRLLAKTRLAGQLALKSGSINGVQCFAGYKIDTAGEPTHAVVILVNNFYCSREKLRQAIEKFILEIF